MLAAINFTHKGKDPEFSDNKEKKSWFKKFNSSFENLELPVTELIKHIQDGYAYTTQHKRRRASENFLAGQHLALDFDTKDERSSFRKLLEDPFIANHASFLHTTASHTPEKPRCRVVFVLEKAIGSPEKYALLAQAIVYRFALFIKTSDKTCKDVCRLFFGAENCEVEILDNVLTFDDALQFLIKPYQVYLDFQKEEEEKNKAAASAILDDSALAAFMEGKKNYLLQKIIDAADGEKHYTLLNISRTFGGYVAGGYYDWSDINRELQNAIRKTSAIDLNSADRTIKAGLHYGEQNPLHPDIPLSPKEKLDTVDPPLTPEQKAQITSILKAEILTYQEMSDLQKELWLKLNIPEYLIKTLKLGYCEKRIDEETGEIIADALTVPFYDGNQLVNIEYRNGTISYSNDVSRLFIVDSDRRHLPTLIFPSSIAAMGQYLQLGRLEFNFTGLPDMPLDPAALGKVNQDITVVLEPDSRPKIKALKGHARIIRLPLNIEEMIQYGLSEKQFLRYIKQGRVWQ